MASTDNYVVSVDDNIFELNKSEIDNLDLVKDGVDAFHCIIKNQNFIIQIVEKDFVNKKLTLKINGDIHHVSIKDHFDLLIEKMGLMTTDVADIKEVHAPMPGLVLDLQIEISQNVQKGDTLLVLEAMKMENMIKSPVDGIVKSIFVKAGEPVDKGQLLVDFQ